jgi:transcriptional regulator with XRE-family HTH domain
MPAAPDERPSRLHKKGPRYLRELRALGLRVRALRLGAGLTLERAAEKCDLDLKHLQKIEGGTLNVTFVTLVRLAQGFKVSMGGLFPAREPGARPRRTGA